jgi:hypothetical protein
MDLILPKQTAVWAFSFSKLKAKLFAEAEAGSNQVQLHHSTLSLQSLQSSKVDIFKLNPPLHQRNTPKREGCARWPSAAASDRPSTARVWAGSMNPSSQSWVLA